MRKTKGFTLVELAVVITIIGLLIGAVIQAQSMIESAQISSTLAQIEAYRGAVSTFKQTYADLPGDMDGEARIPNCSHICKPRGVSFIGDGYVGNTWGAWVWKFREQGLGGTGSAESENAIFWLHLYKAGLITDVSDTLMYDADTPFRFGVTHPAAGVGGGFIVKNPRDYEDQIDAPPVVKGIQGLVIGIAKFPYEETGTTGGLDQETTDENVMTPQEAEVIDHKADDGYPAAGIIQAYGTRRTCFVRNPKAPGGYMYSPTTRTKDCSLIFKIFR